MSDKYLIALTQRLSSYEHTKGLSQSSNGVKVVANTLQFSKDIVSNGNLVASLCEPNKLVQTNQYKQMNSTSLSKWVFGRNLIIEDNKNGSIIIICPQDVSQTAEPTFKKITITDDPLNEKDVVTKKYVDDKLINTTTSDKSLICTNGTVISAKDLQLNGGLFLPNIGGIQTKLDFFEEGVMNINWSGIWGSVVSSTFAYQRIGKWVMMMFPYTSSVAMKSGTITNQQGDYLPSRLCPLYDISLDFNGTDNGIDTLVRVTIYGHNGSIVFKPKNMNYFSGSGISGFNTFSISYMAKNDDLQK